jgi:hypothetical protein
MIANTDGGVLVHAQYGRRHAWVAGRAGQRHLQWTRAVLSFSPVIAGHRLSSIWILCIKLSGIVRNDSIVLS